MQLVVLMLGTFLEQIAIMLFTFQMALTTPPFGLLLFVMKGVAPEGITMHDIYLAGLPFPVCDGIAMAMVIAFPQTVSWLQNLVYT